MRSKAGMANREGDIDLRFAQVFAPVRTLAWLGLAWLGLAWLDLAWHWQTRMCYVESHCNRTLKSTAAGNRNTVIGHWQALQKDIKRHCNRTLVHTLVRHRTTLYYDCGKRFRKTLRDTEIRHWKEVLYYIQRHCIRTLVNTLVIH